MVIRLDMMLARQKMTLLQLSELVGIHPKNLSIMKTGKGRAIKYESMLKICTVLKCTPNDLFEIRRKELTGPEDPKARIV
ncbi:MAG: transcriptional regulator [Chitinophagaceae bacterium]|nr:MAG: transcriptional regulator [Chitinophagaceae bacterium]